MRPCSSNMASLCYFLSSCGQEKKNSSGDRSVLLKLNHTEPGYLSVSTPSQFRSNRLTIPMSMRAVRLKSMATGARRFVYFYVSICLFIFQKAERAASLSWNSAGFMIKREEFPWRGKYSASALFSTTSWIAGIRFERYALSSGSWIGKTIEDCTFLQRKNVLFSTYWSLAQRAQKSPAAGARVGEQNKT